MDAEHFDTIIYDALKLQELYRCLRGELTKVSLNNFKLDDLKVEVLVSCLLEI